MKKKGKPPQRAADAGNMTPPVVRDGSTPERAIVEDQWVWRRRNCPGAKMLLQKLMGRNGKYFDELTLMWAGEVRVLYFDVSDSFKAREL
jgi:hypothetical protein